MSSGEGTHSGHGRAAPGTRLNGIYEIERLIATGGMGEIYKGHAIQTGDDVAIKMIRSDLAENEAALALFKKEASALHNLYNEAIVRYYVFSIDPALGCPYLAMEYVEGTPLSEVVARGPLGFDQTVVLLRRLARALEAAHAIGIVHRDVSPDNVILPGGKVAEAKIIDFGIARSPIGEGTVIGSGFAGKFNYVSPEQLGMFGGDVTPKSDIYSLGLVIAQAMQGRPLDMGGSQVQVIEKRRRVPDLSGIDVRLRPLLSRMLQPDPADRPASMAEVAGWSPGPTAGSAEARRAGRHRAAVLTGILAAIAVFVGAGVALGPTIVRLWSERFPADLPAVAARRDEVPNLAEAPRPRQRSAEVTPAPAPTPPSQVSPSAPPPEPIENPAPSTTTEPAIPPGPGRADRVARYVVNYNGGDCFFATPIEVRDDSASIDAYGASPAPFQKFDDAFQRVAGFEAQIGLRRINPPQCPLASFITQIGGHGGPAPKLQINAPSIRSGQSLTGSVENIDGSQVDLLLVSEDGNVHNLSRFTKRQGNTLSFSVRIDGSVGAAPKPQVLLALASSKPLTALPSASPIPADKLFPAILEEAQRSGQSLGAAVKYFRLES